MFDLNRFTKTVIAPQRSNKYTLRILGPGDLEDVEFLAESVTLPTFQYDKLSSVYRYGFGVKDAFPGVPEYKELMVTLIMQQGSKEHSVMYDWFDTIMRQKPVASGEENSTDKSRFTMAYKDDYVASIEIRLHADVEHSDEAYWEITDAFPISITGDPLSWAESDKYTSYTVTFNYYDMVFKPGSIPTATAPRVRTKDGNSPTVLPYRTTTPPIDDSLDGLPPLLGGP